MALTTGTAALHMVSPPGILMINTEAFCRIDQTAGGTGKCRKIYGMMNFFYPREPPPMIEQVIQLGAVFLRDPVSPSLIFGR